MANDNIVVNRRLEIAQSFYAHAEMEKLDVDWLETSMKRHERDRLISKVQTVREIAPTVFFGNLSSDVHRFAVEVILSDACQSTRSVIVKTVPIGPECHRQFTKEYKMFEQEIKVYERVLKPIRQQMERNGYSEELLWGEMIGYKSHHTILFEDLCARGFQSVDFNNSLFDYRTTVLVLESIARFHSLTLAALRDGLFDPNDFTSCLMTSEKFARQQIASVFKLASTTIMSSWGPEWRDAALRFKKLSESPEKFSSLNPGENKLNVLTHGDLWSGNVMIKRNRRGSPVAVKFIDFQMSHYDSFAWDLNRILYNSVEPKIRREHFEEFLQIYLCNLYEHMRLDGVEMDSSLTIDDVHHEMTRLQPFALLHLFFNVALIACEVDNPVDISKWHSLEGDEKGGLNPEIFKSEKFKSLVEADVKMFLANDQI